MRCLSPSGVGYAAAARAAYLAPVVLLVAPAARCTVCRALAWGMSAATVSTLLVAPVVADRING